GAARARQPGHDPGLHPCLDHAPSVRLSRGPSPGCPHESALRVSGSARTLARAGMIVTSAYLASRLLGWLRTAVISSIYGASPDLDAYFAAFRIPDLVFQLVAAGAHSSALIPVVAGLIANQEEARSW